jgi:hypothetical protein
LIAFVFGLPGRRRRQPGLKPGQALYSSNLKPTQQPAALPNQAALTANPRPTAPQRRVATPQQPPSTAPQCLEMPKQPSTTAEHRATTPKQRAMMPKQPAMTTKQRAVTTKQAAEMRKLSRTRNQPETLILMDRVSTASGSDRVNVLANSILPLKLDMLKRLTSWLTTV